MNIAFEMEIRKVEALVDIYKTARDLNVALQHYIDAAHASKRYDFYFCIMTIQNLAILPAIMDEAWVASKHFFPKRGDETRAHDVARTWLDTLEKKYYDIYVKSPKAAQLNARERAAGAAALEQYQERKKTFDASQSKGTDSYSIFYKAATLVENVLTTVRMDQVRAEMRATARAVLYEKIYSL